MAGLKFLTNFILVVTLTATFSEAVKVQFFEDINFKGKSLEMNFDRCTNLPREWNQDILSVNTFGSCILLFELDDCKDNYMDLVSPDTESHDDLFADGQFNGFVGSVAPCNAWKRKD